MKSSTTSPNAATQVTAAGTTQRPRRSAAVNSAVTGCPPSSWTGWCSGAARSAVSPRQVAQGAGGQSQRHPFGIFFMRKAAVGKRLAQHGDDTLPVAVGRPKIAGRGARGHGWTDNFSA